MFFMLYVINRLPIINYSYIIVLLAYHLTPFTSACIVYQSFLSFFLVFKAPNTVVHWARPRPNPYNFHLHPIVSICSPLLIFLFNSFHYQFYFLYLCYLFFYTYIKHAIIQLQEMQLIWMCWYKSKTFTLYHTIPYICLPKYLFSDPV